jgi:hypothetical protein
MPRDTFTMGFGVATELGSWNEGPKGGFDGIEGRRIADVKR